MSGSPTPDVEPVETGAWSRRLGAAIVWSRLPHTRAQNQAILDRPGLTGAFWRLA